MKNIIIFFLTFKICLMSKGNLKHNKLNYVGWEFQCCQLSIIIAGQILATIKCKPSIWILDCPFLILCAVQNISCQSLVSGEHLRVWIFEAKFSLVFPLNCLPELLPYKREILDSTWVESACFDCLIYGFRKSFFVSHIVVLSLIRTVVKVGSNLDK